MAGDYAQQRIENMTRRKNTKTNQMLETINTTSDRMTAIINALPPEAAARVINFSTANVYFTDVSVMDFYGYDYDEDILASMTEHIGNQTTACQKVLNTLEEYKDELVHNYDPTTYEDDQFEIKMIDVAINDIHDVLSYIVNSDGGYQASIHMNVVYNYDYSDDSIEAFDEIFEKYERR